MAINDEFKNYHPTTALYSLFIDRNTDLREVEFINISQFTHRIYNSLLTIICLSKKKLMEMANWKSLQGNAELLKITIWLCNMPRNSTRIKIMKLLT